MNTDTKQMIAETLVDVFLRKPSTEAVIQLSELAPLSLPQSVIDRIIAHPYSEEQARLLWALARTLSRTVVQYEDPPASQQQEQSERRKNLWFTVKPKVIVGLNEGLACDTKNILNWYIHPAAELLIVQSDDDLEHKLNEILSHGELSMTDIYTKVDMADSALRIAKAARAIETHNNEELAKGCRSSRTENRGGVGELTLSFGDLVRL